MHPSAAVSITEQWLRPLASVSEQAEAPVFTFLGL